MPGAAAQIHKRLPILQPPEVPRIRLTHMADGRPRNQQGKAPGADDSVRASTEAIYATLHQALLNMAGKDLLKATAAPPPQREQNRAATWRG
jgi:hypothetical protein